MARWLVTSVGRLVRAGHTLEQIRNYSHSTFLTMLLAEDQYAAQARLDFITDMSAVVAGAFSSEDGVLSEHMTSIENAARGASHGS